MIFVIMLCWFWLVWKYLEIKKIEIVRGLFKICKIIKSLYKGMEFLRLYLIIFENDI